MAWVAFFGKVAPRKDLLDNYMMPAGCMII
jgi:hypothetical protein